MTKKLNADEVTFPAAGSTIFNLTMIGQHWPPIGWYDWSCANYSRVTGETVFGVDIDWPVAPAKADFAPDEPSLGEDS